jgi:hypothetical protein
MELKRSPSHPFRGEPFLYNGWITSLNNRMNALQLKATDRIDILEAHTTGAPRDVIQTFKTAYGSRPDAALLIILEKLDRRFGSEIEIATVLRQRLSNFPEISGIEGSSTVALKLRELSDLCVVIHAHMDTVHDLRTLNHSSGLEIVRRKLPAFLNNSWRNSSANYHSRNGYHPDFGYFCDFLENKSDMLCSDIIQSAESTPRTSYAARPALAKHPTVLQTSAVTTEQNFACPLHRSDNHKISSCYIFSGMEGKAKRLLVNNYGLCIRCMEKHPCTTEECTSEIKCDRCGMKNHVTALHWNPPAVNMNHQRNQHQSYRNRSQNPSAEDDYPKALCTAVCGDEKGKSCGKTLLVEVWAEGQAKNIRTYAIIDEQSTNSFATSSLFNAISPNAPLHDYKLTTMSSQNCKIT